MNEFDLEKPLGRKLAHAYVAVAMSRNVANHILSEQPAHAGLTPLLNLLDVTARMMEDILESAPEYYAPISLEASHSEMIM
jgi:hypothetical protein